MGNTIPMTKRKANSVVPESSTDSCRKSFGTTTGIGRAEGMFV